VLIRDVCIVGAGPAGTAAAITLARHGRSVTVIDKATFPRDKICGDGLTTGALRLLEELGLDPHAVASWMPVDDVVVRGPSGREVTFPLPRDGGAFAVVARREELDDALVQLARAAGAELLEGEAFVSLQAGTSNVTITTSSGKSIACRYVIAADGMWSSVRKALGVGINGYLGEWHAFRQYFTGVSPRAANELMVWFEPDLLPGYAWSFPLPNGGANVGFGIVRGGEHRVQDMKRLWPDLLARPHIAAFLGPAAQPEQPHRAWPIPARIDDIVLSTGRVLFVGDAAAASDPMTGEGIGQALLSGLLAAEAIAHGHSLTPDRVRRDYEKAIRRELVADHRVAHALMRVIAHRRGANAALAIAGATGWTRRNFARWLFEDYPRATLLTPRRWHRGIFSSPGATFDDAHAAHTRH
jgi:geranylgeranyl reductase family protein